MELAFLSSRKLLKSTALYPPHLNSFVWQKNKSVWNFTIRSELRKAMKYKKYALSLTV